MTAEERIRKIKKSIRGKDTYSTFSEHKIMENYSIGYQELLDFPFEKYLEFSQIITEETKEEKKRKEKQERKMDQEV